MQKQILKILFTFALLLLGNNSVFAAPSNLNMANGELRHGQNATVTGSAFGFKTPAAPLYWKTFDGLTTGALLPDVDSDFTPTAPHPDSNIVRQSVVISENDQRNNFSSKNLYAHVVGGDVYQTTRPFAIANIPEILASHKMYVNMWYRNGQYRNCEQCDIGGGAPDVDTQYKLLRLTADSDGWGFDAVSPYALWAYWDFDTYSKNYWAYAVPSTYFANAIHTDGKWHNISVAMDQNIPSLKSWLSFEDFSLPISAIDACTSGCPNLTPGDGEQWIDTFYVHNYVDQNADPEDSDAYAELYYDDIYIDSTFARIEIGDTATYSTNTHREIQIPSAWSDNTIIFQVNKGSFPDGQAYLFVIDENDNPSEGYPITFTSGADMTAPAAPSGLSVH